MMATARVHAPTVMEFTRDIYAEVIQPGSPEHQEARALQQQRFARASELGEQTAYLSTVDFAPHDTVPIVIRRRPPESLQRTGGWRLWRPRPMPPAEAPLIGTVRLELPGAMMIPEVVRFVPGSHAERLIEQDTVAEIGGLATAMDLDIADILDVIDAAVGALLQVARAEGISWLWLFPRRTLMGLLLAEIPGVLPRYSFKLCHEVIGWREESPRLKEVRELRVKALRALPDEYPIVYGCSAATLATDLARRQTLIEARREIPGLKRVLLGSMRDAQRAVDSEVTAATTELRKRRTGRAPGTTGAPTVDSEKTENIGDTMSGDEQLRKSGTTPGAGDVSAPTAARTTASVTSGVASGVASGRQGFLPFAANADDKVNYLRTMMTQDDVRAYKALSYDLLDVHPGMRVLDVGCGAGADMPALSGLVGPSGRVVGLERDADLVTAAKQGLDGQGLGNVLILAGDATAMTFPTAAFDRARADRVLQHVPEPRNVLREMWRVLRPGGIATLIEPDWRAIALYPGSATGGDNDETLTAILARYQRHLPHALIGRQLRALLEGQTEERWSDVRVRGVAFTLLSWPVVDAVLQLAASAQALAIEVPARATQIQEWFAAVSAADARSEFFATIPLFFAVARKPLG